MQTSPSSSTAYVTSARPSDQLTAWQRIGLFWSQLIALIALVQFVLVLFNLSYVPLRSLYLEFTPIIVNAYDPVKEMGQFWQIDLWFMAIFAVDVLGRSLISSYRQPQISWGDAILRRWYDLLFFLPYWRWLRALPVAVRLHQSKLVNMENALAQLTHEPASYLADRVSKFVMVRFVNQMQSSIQHGDVAKFLFEPSQYTQVSDINKIDAITDRLIQLSIYRVLPEVQPDLEALLHHSLATIITESDFYTTVQRIPGIGDLPDETLEQLAEYLAQGTYDVLNNVYSDQEGRMLMEQLSQEFRQALKQQLQEKQTQQELETLLIDLLEELKINYIERSSSESPAQTMNEVEQIHKIVQEANALPPAHSSTKTPDSSYVDPDQIPDVLDFTQMNQQTDVNR